MDKICLGYLSQVWQGLVPDHPQSNRIFDQVIDSYSGAQRFYHTTQHLCHLIELLQESSVDDPAAYWAAFYHDYIYVAGKPDNEAKSADFANAHLNQLNVNSSIIERCCELILMTKTHQMHQQDKLAACFLDADMAILGVDPESYAVYVANIKKEFSSIPGFLFNQGRKKFITGCLNQQRLYYTDWFFDRFEIQARKNLAWELTTL
jgi:predicted metal-dependent HD superfamily phosphohydrolase